MFALLIAVGCTQAPRGGMPGGAVVLDIGHYEGAPGARTPGPVRGQRISEYDFWCRYVGEVKRVVQAAGYSCVVTNRGYAPTQADLRSATRRAGVVQLRRPDVAGGRYPSRYHPDRVGAGMVSADYAIWRRASCAVFLHHNSSSRRWVRGASPSIILYNKWNGRALAESLCRTLDAEVLDHGMPNGGRGCRPVVKYVDADRSAGWLNACDDSGIPAVVVEAAFLNNRNHAEFLAQDANARRYAQSIGKAIVAYLRRNGSSKRHYRADENAPDAGSFGYARESRSAHVPGAKRLLH